MRTKNRTEHPRFYWLHRFVTVSAVATVLAFALSVTGWADALYILTGLENTAIVLKEDAELSALARKTVYRAETGRSWDVSLDAGQTVNILHGGVAVTVESRQERVSALLDRMNVEVGENEMVQIDLSAPGTVMINIAPDIIYYDRETVPTAFATVRRPSTEIPVGTERVVQEGRDGETVCVYEVVWSGGERISHELVESTVSSAVDQIVEYGVPAEEGVVEEVRAEAGAVQIVEINQTVEAVRTETAPPAEEPASEPKPEPKPEPEAQSEGKSAVKENSDSSLPMDKLVDVQSNGDGTGVLVFASGRTARYKGVKSMSATAYNKDEPKVGTITAMGTKVHKGVVAVDRRVIPLGTRLYVVAKGYEYGYSVAEDTGVFGNTIDLYFESYQGMVNFGRRSATVYILE